LATVNAVRIEDLSTTIAAAAAGDAEGAAEEDEENAAAAAAAAEATAAGVGSLLARDGEGAHLREAAAQMHEMYDT
jgi:hypothetical protein